MSNLDHRVEHFDLGEWIESVEGETIQLFEPDGLGPRPPGFRSSEHLCGNCEEMVMLVGDGDDPIPTSCPLCGRQIGILERGTQSVEEWRSLDEEAKNV